MIPSTLTSKKMSHSEKQKNYHQLPLRIPLQLFDQMKEINENLGISYRDQIIYSLMQTMPQRYPLRDITEISPKPVPKKTAKISPNDISLARAYIINNNIYSIYKDNKKKIYIDIYDASLKETWEEWLKYRRVELRKAITPPQYERQWTKYQKIIDVHGVEGLIKCMKTAMDKGWVGVAEPDWISDLKVASTATQFNEDD